jgi:hypothetical protein
MPRSPAPEWAKRKEPIMDDFVFASINAANGKHDPDTGHYATLVYAGCSDRERAKEISNRLFSSALWLTKHKKASVSMSTKIKPASDGTYSVEYVVINKAHARKFVLEKYGTDRSKWAYDPRKTGG